MRRRPARRESGEAPAGERRFNHNEVVIEVAGTPTQQQVEAMARRHGLNREESQSFDLSGTTMFRWTIPDGRNVNTVVRGLEADSSDPVGAAELSLHAAAVEDRRRHSICRREVEAAACA